MKILLPLFFLFVSLTSFSQEVKDVIVEEATLLIQGNDQLESELKWTENGYIYDQPVLDVFTISTLEDDVYKLIVFNSFGEKMMYQENLDSLISVDVSELSQGTYYVVLRGDRFKKSFKFTKV